MGELIYMSGVVFYWNPQVLCPVLLLFWVGIILPKELDAALSCSFLSLGIASISHRELYQSFPTFDWAPLQILSYNYIFRFLKKKLCLDSRTAYFPIHLHISILSTLVPRNS
jgi:hypothetical protein